MAFFQPEQSKMIFFFRMFAKALENTIAKATVAYIKENMRKSHV